MESHGDDSMYQMTVNQTVAVQLLETHANTDQPAKSKYGTTQNSEHLKQLGCFKVKPELLSAAEILVTAYYDVSHDSELKNFFDCFKSFLTPEPAPVCKNWSWNPLNWHLSGGSKTSSPTVMVHTVTTGLTFGADTALMRRVTNCEKLNVKEADKRGGSVVLLFCPITSRPGSDVKVAMSKVSGDKPVILVMMHHTRKPDFFCPTTSWSEDFPNVILHVDIFFHETLCGLLTCSNNDNAVRQIQLQLLEISKKLGNQQ